MRLLLKLSSSKMIPENQFDKYSFQSAIYSTLINTNFEGYHNKPGYKFFTFSDFFPSGDLIPKNIKNIIISSPNYDLIKTIYEYFDEKRVIYLRNYALDILELKFFKIKEKFNSVVTGSPIVIYDENKKNKYFSFRDNGSISFFLRRLKENAIKKYCAYKKIDNFDLNSLIFDSLKFRKEVVVNLKKGDKQFFFIGSLWYYLKKSHINSKYFDFYRFILDTGLGEKNSLGFGFLNPIGVM
ncbi:MAG: CRISPR-associated endoribonuclease Cas6 [Thermoplasmata archaeon]